MSNSQITSETVAAFETAGQAAGLLSSDGFFTQSDTEFEVDMASNSSLAELQAHLISGGLNADNAQAIKGYLVGTKPFVIPFKHNT